MKVFDNLSLFFKHLARIFREKQKGNSRNIKQTLTFDSVLVGNETEVMKLTNFVGLR